MPKKRILIVDDESEARGFMKRYLERNDFEVTSVGSGLLGLKLLKMRRFDLLISDINMPRMDGVEFSKKAKFLDPNLIIILLTGQGALKTAQQAIKIGIHDYLTKPVELEELNSSIQKGLKLAAEKKKDADYYQKLEGRIRANKDSLDSAKNELIALISHELITPLNVVTSAFDLLKDATQLPSPAEMQTLSKDQKKGLFENIEGGHRRLATIIEDFTDYLSLAKSEVSLNKEIVDLNTVLSSSFESFKDLIGEYKADLKLELAEESLRVEITKEKIVDVLERLIHNSAYHNPAGTDIVLKTSSSDKNFEGKDLRVVKLEVCDNGKGIKKSLLKDIFNPFNIGDIYHHSKGLGLGLCICKRVIELHDADIKVVSSEGKGTKLVIEFPAASEK